MSDDKTKVGGQDRNRIAMAQDYEVEDFHQKRKHLSHERAKQIIKAAGGNRQKADEMAEAER